MKKPWQKTSSMEGSFARKPILSETNSRITLSNESATDDTDKRDTLRFSLKQKLAALAALLTAMSGFAYCHNTAEAPVSSETAATAEPFGQSGREVEFTTPDGEIDVKKVDREVLHGITTRYTELKGKKTDRYMGDSLAVYRTDKSRAIKEIITAKRATVSHDGQNVVVTTVAHKQKDITAGKTTTREKVTLETPQEPGAAQPVGELTTVELLQITSNPATEVAAASSFRPSANTDPNEKLYYIRMTRTTNENGAPTFAIEEAPASKENPDDIPSDDASWQPASQAGTGKNLKYMLQFWCA
jgi:hypothetical protein